MENHEIPARHGTARLGILTTISWSKYVNRRRPTPVEPDAALEPALELYNLLDARLGLPVRSAARKHCPGAVAWPLGFAPVAPQSKAWELAGSEFAESKLARSDLSRIPLFAAAERSAGSEQYASVPGTALRPPQRTAGPAPELAESCGTRFSPRAHRSSVDPPDAG